MTEGPENDLYLTNAIQKFVQSFNEVRDICAAEIQCFRPWDKIQGKRDVLAFHIGSRIEQQLHRRRRPSSFSRQTSTTEHALNIRCRIGLSNIALGGCAP